MGLRGAYDVYNAKRENCRCVVVLGSWNWMCGGPCGCVVVFFFGWIWIYGTWVFGVDLWWLLEKIFDVWWFWSPGFGCVVVVWMCGG